MFQYTVDITSTSNENIIKFNINSFLTRAQSYEFKNMQEAKLSPLAEQLFQLPFIKTVFISQNFVAVEKHDVIDWKSVQQDVAELISDYLNTGKPVITPEKPAEKLPTSIYAESTPNPSVMKFIANRSFVDTILEYKHVSEARQSPLAMELFSFPFVKEVFFNQNYVSIMKYDMVEWEEITMQLREFIKNYIENGKPITNDISSSAKEDVATSDQNQSELSAKPRSEFENKIVSILDEYVIPAVAQDGGNILFESFDTATKTVRVVLQGACSGCPSSTVTLKNGIERLLKQMLGSEIENVEAING